MTVMDHETGENHMRAVQIILTAFVLALLIITGCKKEDDTPPVTYTVTFDSQGADTEADPVSMTVTSPATTLGELPTEPSKSGYAFSAWFTEPDGGGMMFTAYTTVTEDITVYAKWIQVEFSVSYDANGGSLGSVPADNNSYEYNDPVTVSDNSGSLAGPVIRDEIRQRFIGWNRDPDATSYEYLPGHTMFITGDVTLYAIYTQDDDVLRKLGPGGGWVFYDAGSAESWGRYLEAANPGWIDEGDDPRCEWGLWADQGEQSVQIIDEAGNAIGTGLNNTSIIISFYDALYLKSDGTTSYYDYDWVSLTAGTKETFTDGVSDYEFSSVWDDYDGTVAAKVCHDYSVVYNEVTYDDWFLPSKDELNQMYLNLSREGVEGFAQVNAYYWSSSESDGRNAWYQFFGTMGDEDGPQDYSGKASVYWVRAVRAF